MIESLKKMDKKFLYTVGIILIVPIFIILILMIVRGCSNGGTSYEKYQEKMVKEAEHYFEYHKLLPKLEGKEVVVTLDELVSDGLKEPTKAINDSSCTGTVTVKNNGGEYLYIPYLECGEYTTDYLINHIIKDKTTKESGLYQVGKEYLYKGNKVNNYLSFYGTIYRIIKVDENGNLKLIKQKREEQELSWDEKYNVQTEENNGINDYYNSDIYDELWANYNNEKLVTKDMKKHMIAYNVCLDKKAKNDVLLEQNTCQNVLKEQFISLPSIYDYAFASYDSNCKQIGDGACSNFNYLENVITSTWTVNSSSDDTHSVYYIAGSYVDTQSADTYKGYYWIISVSGNELYSSGDGSAENPYIIK